MTNSIILKSDSYKYSHPWQYPPGTTHVTSYIEARGFDRRLFNDTEPEVLLCGLEWFVEDFLAKRVTASDVHKAREILTAHGVPFQFDGWMRIVDHHKGVIPVRIQALPEGTPAPIGVPLVQVTNTDPELPWVTSFIETALLRAIWYPTTVATVSREAKKIIKRWLDINGDPTGLPFKLHDFGARGATTHEAALYGGMAHLINFMGTDTIEAVEGIYDRYDGLIAGYSIPASEHSTITSWGRNRELAAFANMLDQFPTGLVACVSDSYNIFEACHDLWGTKLRDRILNRDGVLVVRPDSGDPVEMTLAVIEILGERFGYTTNAKGAKVLDPHVRMIQGDGVNLRSIDAILRNFNDHGWSADNIAFGMGGGLLQAHTRDTLKFAMKANEIVVNGTTYPVYKDPITDPGKSSKHSKQAVYRDDGKLMAINANEYDGIDLLELAYEDGDYVHHEFEDIRARADLK